MFGCGGVMDSLISSIEMLKSHESFLGAVIGAFISGYFILMRAGLLRIDRANDAYAAILMKDIVNGRIVSNEGLFLIREGVALRYKIHESRMIGPAEGMVFAVVDYLAQQITEQQREQFQYNLTICRKRYKVGQEKNHRRVKRFLKDWMFSEIVIFLVFMADNHFFSHIDLHLMDYIALIGMTAVLSFISTLVSCFIIYLRWERDKQKKEQNAYDLVGKLCGVK
jgi:hypothetical protein